MTDTLEIKHLTVKTRCPACKHKTEMHEMVITDSFTVAICTECGKVIRSLSADEQKLHAKMIPYAQMRVVYPKPLELDDTIVCSHCWGPIKVDHYEGNAVCLEPTCAHFWRLNVKAGKLIEMERAKKDVMKRIGEQLNADGTFYEEDQAELQNLNKMIEEAQR